MLRPLKKMGCFGYNIEYTVLLNSHSQSAIFKMQQMNYTYLQNKILILDKIKNVCIKC